jgi:hypothetical protein
MITKRSHRLTSPFLLMVALAGLPACEPDQATTAGDVATVQQAVIDSTYAVGVFVDGDKCPAGSSLVEISMDVQDAYDGVLGFGGAYTSCHRDTGWVSKNTPSKGSVLCSYEVNAPNVVIKACRADGLSFKPLAAATPNTPQHYYAVLMLGSFCPPGSTHMQRWIDNDDFGHTFNSHSGDIKPNGQDRNTALNFCFFRFPSAESGSMIAFPLLSVEYAVLHDFDGVQPSWVDKKRSVFSDDSDEDNQNWGQPDIGPVAEAFSPILQGFPHENNTEFEYARVKRILFPLSPCLLTDCP